MDKIPFDPYDFFGYLASGLLVLVGMQLVCGFPKVLGQDLRLLDSSLLILFIYVAGHIAATPAKALLEDIVVEKLLQPPSINLLTSPTKPTLWARLFPGFYKPLPEATRLRVLDKAKREGITSTGEDLFSHVRYSPQTLKNSTLMASLSIFLSRYGFARNLSFTSAVVGLAFLAKGLLTEDHDLLRYAAIALIAAVLLFYRYLKFLRQYSFELFSVYGCSPSES